MSVNKCIFIGNMGRDAEVRTTETGIKVAQFSIACTERAYTNKAGQTVAESIEMLDPKRDAPPLPPEPEQKLSYNP